MSAPSEEKSFLKRLGSEGFKEFLMRLGIPLDAEEGPERAQEAFEQIRKLFSDLLGGSRLITKGSEVSIPAQPSDAKSTEPLFVDINLIEGVAEDDVPKHTVDERSLPKLQSEEAQDAQGVLLMFLEMVLLLRKEIQTLLKNKLESNDKINELASRLNVSDLTKKRLIALLDLERLIRDSKGLFVDLYQELIDKIRKDSGNTIETLTSKFLSEVPGANKMLGDITKLYRKELGQAASEVALKLDAIPQNESFERIFINYYLNLILKGSKNKQGKKLRGMLEALNADSYKIFLLSGSYGLDEYGHLAMGKDNDPDISNSQEYDYANLEINSLIEACQPPQSIFFHRADYASYEEDQPTENRYHDYLARAIPRGAKPILDFVRDHTQYDELVIAPLVVKGISKGMMLMDVKDGAMQSSTLFDIEKLFDTVEGRILETFPGIYNDTDIEKHQGYAKKIKGAKETAASVLSAKSEELHVTLVANDEERKEQLIDILRQQGNIKTLNEVVIENLRATSGTFRTACEHQRNRSDCTGYERKTYEEAIIVSLLKDQIGAARTRIERTFYFDEKTFKLKGKTFQVLQDKVKSKLKSFSGLKSDDIDKVFEEIKDEVFDSMEDLNCEKIDLSRDDAIEIEEKEITIENWLDELEEKLAKYYNIKVSEFHVKNQEYLQSHDDNEREKLKFNIILYENILGHGPDTGDLEVRRLLNVLSHIDQNEIIKRASSILKDLPENSPYRESLEVITASKDDKEMLQNALGVLRDISNERFKQIERSLNAEEANEQSVGVDEDNAKYWKEYYKSIIGKYQDSHLLCFFWNPNAEHQTREVNRTIRQAIDDSPSTICGFNNATVQYMLRAFQKDHSKANIISKAVAVEKLRSITNSIYIICDNLDLLMSHKEFRVFEKNCRLNGQEITFITPDKIPQGLRENNNQNASSSKVDNNEQIHKAIIKILDGKPKASVLNFSNTIAIEETVSSDQKTALELFTQKGSNFFLTPKDSWMVVLSSNRAE